jgi:outer membrane protein, heavy metal efflux system
VSIRSILIFILWAGILTAQENQISIAFSDLPELIKQTSPQSKIINTEHEAIKAESEATLQWSNPEVNYDFEQVDFAGAKETEQSIFLSKSFDLPWNYLQERNIWQSEVRAADFDRKQNMNQLLADMRSGYVRLSLMQKLTRQLSELTTILNDVQQTLQARHEEGALSQMDATLLSMSLFGLEANIIDTQQESRQVLIDWKTSLGIDRTQEINLTDFIKFKNIPTDNLLQQQLLENHPGVQARQNRLDALSGRVSLEKWKIIPSFSLQGGYKKVDPGWEGYVLGISLPLPLLNWSGAQIEKQKIEQILYETETSIYKHKMSADIQNLILSVQANTNLFKKIDYSINHKRVVEDLVAAYLEGTLSLTDFLSSLQLVRENSRHYVEQLVNYYQAVFELEAFSGQQLVTF